MKHISLDQTSTSEPDGLIEGDFELVNEPAWNGDNEPWGLKCYNCGTTSWFNNYCDGENCTLKFPSELRRRRDFLNQMNILV